MAISPRITSPSRFRPCAPTCFGFTRRDVGEVEKRFTFAPEAGSVRMRKFINKNISNEELFRRSKQPTDRAGTRIKLYFMIGLPTEADQDIRLVDLIREVGKIGEVKGGKTSMPASGPLFQNPLHLPMGSF
jgi:radical SAM superfamily enzyme YgiQ (UPF0313 family)